MAYGNLTAIGKTGLLRSCGLAINHYYLVPRLRQIPGATDTDYTCAEHDYTHGEMGLKGIVAGIGCLIALW